MSKNEFDETRDFWNNAAEDWRIQVGDDGDANRSLNSDPVLWKFTGEVRGLKVLDAGCGTGYLSKKLTEKGALVTGIDFSERMIAIARAANPGGDFRVDSCSELRTIDDKSFDMIVSNYVIMDTPDLSGTMEAFHRVLRLGGFAVLVFSHPCFPQGRATRSEDGDEIEYVWKVSYFQQHKRIDPPWGHFKADFTWFHRPLSDYWKAFTGAGFEVIEFEEPRITQDRYDLAKTAKILKDSQTRPYSVAFKLRKADSR